MLKPQVSVVIPVCNQERFVAACLDSVCGQTMENIEILCVDDGSTDASPAILDEYARRDKRIRVIHQENAGAGPARNAALDVATGEYVVFMDPDDRYPSNGVLETLYNAVRGSSCKVAGGFARCFPEDNPRVAALDRKGARICAFPRFGELDYREYQVPYRYWCYIYSCELLDGVRFPDLRVFQDVVFFVDAMRKAGRFLALDFCSYGYRQHPGNASRTMNPEKIRDRLRGYCLVLDRAEDAGYDRLYASMVGSLLSFRRRNGLSPFRIVVTLGLRRLPHFAGVYLQSRLARRGRLVAYLRWWRSLSRGRLGLMLRQKWSRTGVVVRSRRHRVEKLPLDPKKVVFHCVTRNCTCNPKAIARALLRRRPETDVVWLLDDDAFRSCGGTPDTGRAVRLWTWTSFRECATAGTVVENAFLSVAPAIPPKREGQRVMNTWHGSLGIKRLGTSQTVLSGRVKRECAAIDVALSNSAFEDRIFSEDMMRGVRLVRIGHPRNDIFFLPEAERTEIRHRVYATLGLPEDLHLALFAPTFREDAFVNGRCVYDLMSWQKALEDRFGGSWKVLLRMHPMDARAAREGLIAVPQGVPECSGYDDIQELLIAVDAGITDYSSWIYDYLLCGRPGFLYAPDRAEYENARGLYYPLESTPFPVSGTNAELCAAIRAFDEKKFARDRERFLRDKGCMEDGHASQRAVDIIEKWMDEGATNGAR